jgi:integrase/recombinase XerD
MPSGERYWTLLNDDLEPVVAADEFLRFGRDAAESTTRSYAGGIALFCSGAR